MGGTIRAMGASKPEDRDTNLGKVARFKERLKKFQISRIFDLEVKIPSSAKFGDWFNCGWEKMYNEDEFDLRISGEDIATTPLGLNIDRLINSVSSNPPNYLQNNLHNLTSDASADCFSWYHQGNRLEDAGYYDEAVSCYQQALRLEPQLICAWNRLGAIFCDYLQRYEDALACFNQALRLNYLDDLTWYNRGNVLEMMECYEDAIASYDLAIKLNPDDEGSWYGRGWSLYCLGELNDAITSFQQAISLKPSDDSAWYNQACCYALQGHVTQAVRCLRQAIQLSPNQYRHMAKTEADFDEIRIAPEFCDLMGEIG
ncbi:tetratricopeptide repeat protein [Calothrix sp. NIES-3974]|uniref:tetratricopeptide repeat protein n=1 Tax=Calothrix sp. NIES-3974 TaxID=2005462 RepID=UPI001E505EC7|nr:tetratricopeptide repeat protein [Calothrix sp. NIES-3974]